MVNTSRGWLKGLLFNYYNLRKFAGVFKISMCASRVRYCYCYGYCTLRFDCYARDYVSISICKKYFFQG